MDTLQVDALLEGVQLHDEPARIAATGCEVRSEHLLRMTVTEGKYHLVKRMIAAAGNRVEGLNRIAIGGFPLPDSLPIGPVSYTHLDVYKRQIPSPLLSKKALTCSS